MGVAGEGKEPFCFLPVFMFSVCSSWLVKHCYYILNEWFKLEYELKTCKWQHIKPRIWILTNQNLIVNCQWKSQLKIKIQLWIWRIITSLIFHCNHFLVIRWLSAALMTVATSCPCMTSACSGSQLWKTVLLSPIILLIVHHRIIV